MSIDFVALMPDVARTLLGEPNREMSNKIVLRYGKRGSLAVDLSKGTFFDFEKGDSGGVLGLIQREQGLDKNEAVAWLVEQGLISNAPNGAWRDQVVASYNYHDASGKVLYVVARLEPKDFRQYRPHPTIPDQRIWALKAGTYVQHAKSATDWCKATDARTAVKGWTKSVILPDNIVHGLYNLPALLARDLLATVYLAEGEKDCDALGRIGLLATTNSGGAKFWAARHAEVLRGTDVVLLIDNDAAGRERGDKIAATLVGKARRVRVLDIAAVWPECPPKGDVTDWLRKGGGTPERLTEIVAGLPDWEPPEPREEPPPTDHRWPDWDKKNSRPAATFANACVALRRLDLNLYYDECRYRMMGLGKDLQTREGNVSDVMSLRIRRLVRDRFGFDPGKEHTNDAIIDLAHDHKRHPFRDDYLTGLIWDGTARLDKLFVTYFNVTDNAYHQALSRIFLIAAVRRVRKPGTPFDLLPLLESPQGWEKSNGIKALVGIEYHSDQSVWRTRDTKRQMEMMEGVVVFEIGELQGLTDSNMDEIKTFASRTVDADRMAYDRFKVFRPGQCVFMGTTNKVRYLLDATGNRRFEPMKVNSPIDVRAIERDRDQLWAEAAHREAAGESIALPQELWAAAARAQNARTVHDPWEDDLIRYLDMPHAEIEIDKEGHEIIASASLLGTALSLTTDRREPKHTHRLGNIMRGLGWEGPNKFAFASGRAKGYRRTKKAENSQPADLLDFTEEQ